MSPKSVCLRLAGSVLALAAAQAAHGQATAPSSITPPTLRPDDAGRSVQIAIPEAGALVAPAGSENLSVSIDRVVVEGGFAEVADATAAIVAPLQGHRSTVADVYKAASEIEAAHARAGFVLARVVVPPQSLIDGGTLRIVVIDGFIDQVDVSGVPTRVRHAVDMRVEKLKGRHHVKLAEIEQALLIADQVPGLTLSSTLTRGAKAGATTLVLAGRHALVSGQVSADNSLASSLGTYGFNVQASLNSAFGLGEQIYGFAASGYDLSRVFQTNVPVRVLGGGIVLPIGDGRLSFNPEATFSRTRPSVRADALHTRGDLRRLTMRADYTAFRTRTRALTIDAVAEQIDETNALPAFGADISHDRFMAARIGATFTANQAGGSAIIVNGQISQGLGGLGALGLSDLPIGTTYSRQGARHDFTKIDLSLHALVPLPSGYQLTLVAKGQSSFGKALFRAEQTALEGSDALSAYVGGVTAVDEAVIGRAELGKAFTLPGIAQVGPYIFGAGGAGRIDRPTIFERGHLDAGSAGIGVRAAIIGTGVSLGAEYAHGFSDDRPLHDVDRVNATISLRF